MGLPETVQRLADYKDQLSIPTVVERAGLEFIRRYIRISSSVGSWRYHRDFQNVDRMCLFIGHPRSGHSVIGSLLDAHPNIVIAHELDVLKFVKKGFVKNKSQLFYQLIKRSKWFENKGAEWSGYKYSVPSQFKGSYISLNTIGDKKGGTSTILLRQRKDLIELLWSIVKVPIHVIHVSRNPLDNIATMSKKDYNGNVKKAIERYFMDCETILDVKRRYEQRKWFKWLDIRQEEFIHETEENLKMLCNYLGEECSYNYLNECSNVVFDNPKKSRKKVDYTEEDISNIRLSSNNFYFLESYKI